MSLRCSTLRLLAAPRLATRPSSRVLLPSRTLVSSAPRFASEPPSRPLDPLSDPVLKGVIDKVANHEGARAAMEKIEKLMREKGIDMSKPPSTMTMMKLGMDKEIREAGMQLIAAFKDAGVEITPENAAALMGKFKM